MESGGGNVFVDELIQSYIFYLKNLSNRNLCIGECQQQSGVLRQLNSSDINR